MGTYEIFADVSLDIDVEFAQRNQVKYIPMEYMLGNETYHCDSPESDEMMHHFYEALRGKIPTHTSQITPWHYVEAWESYAKEGTPVLYLALSGGLSDTCGSAEKGKAELLSQYPDAGIEVVDSIGATGGMGLLVEAACKNRDAGMSLQENATWLRAHANNINYWFKVEDLMYLMRGGRVSAATAVMGTALNIKPVLRINAEGKLETIAKKRGDKLAIRYMIERFEETYDPALGNTVYLSCADCKDNAQALKELLLEKYPDLEIKITMLSPIIGAHTGPDMLALIHWGKAK